MNKFRSQKIAKIKIAQSQLGMADDTYRLMLQRVTGKNSCTKLNDLQLDQVITEMKRLGFIPRKSSNLAPIKPAKNDAPMLSKINALLADAGKPETYAISMAKHMFGKERLEWLDSRQLHKLVAALQINANRRTKND